MEGSRFASLTIIIYFLMLLISLCLFGFRSLCLSDHPHLHLVGPWMSPPVLGILEDRIGPSFFCLFFIFTRCFYVCMSWIIDRCVCCVSRSCRAVEVKNSMVWQQIDVLSWLPVWELGVMSSGYLKFSQTGIFLKASEHYLVVGAEGKSSVFACSPCDLGEP